MRYLIPLLGAVALAGCMSDVPDSAAGVGFGDYVDYQSTRAERDAALEGPREIPIGPAISDEAVAGGGARTPGPVTTNNPGISDEQNFEAVAERETIESDAERLARQRAAYEVIAPTRVPSRPGGERPNLVAYALSTTNDPGQAVWRRTGVNAEARFQRACAGYASADLAQEAFLAAGGPERDRRGMDPDGDGFACAWDPRPFRAARDAARAGR